MVWSPKLTLLAPPPNGMVPQAHALGNTGHGTIHACIHPSIHPGASIHPSIHTYTDIHTYLSTYLPTYLHTYVHTYIHACMHAYIHTYQHTNIPTYQHTTTTGHRGGDQKNHTTTTGHRGGDQKNHTTIPGHRGGDHGGGRGGLGSPGSYIHICSCKYTYIYITRYISPTLKLIACQATAKLHHRGPENELPELGRGGGSLAAAIDGALESEVWRGVGSHPSHPPFCAGKIGQ